MAYKKFKDNEILLNTMRTYPDAEFAIFNGQVYYNNTPDQAGIKNDRTRNIPSGYISLYEYNIDRPLIAEGDITRYVGSSSIPDNGRIYPWISKDSAGASFKTAGLGGAKAYSAFKYGDIIRNTYPLSASITREYVATPSSSSPAGAGTFNAHFVALKNRLNYYGARSEHYLVSSSHGNKNSQAINFVHIPSIFYGSKIKPGSVSLKWFQTGSLIGELRDTSKNGELRQISSSAAASKTYNDEVAGVVLYDEGIILLTGSWDLNHETIEFSSTFSGRPAWTQFGAGGNDGTTPDKVGSSFKNASYNLSFQGTTDTQVMTMFAHASRGQVNYSNNPSFIKYGQEKIFKSSSTVYHENNEREIINIVSSSYSDYSASYKRQVYISKVAIYDKNRNLIGVATLGSPILKEDNQSYTFKLKLDI